jgi:hypothetical protein
LTADDFVVTEDGVPHIAFVSISASTTCAAAADPDAQREWTGRPWQRCRRSSRRHRRASSGDGRSQPAPDHPVL